MSKFIDRLNDISRVAPQPMGFRVSAGAAARYKIQLIARITVEDLEPLGEVLAGADAVLLDVPAGMAPEAMPDLGKILGQRIWGFHSGAATRALFAEIGPDFIVLSAESSLKTLETEKQVGRLMETDASMADGLLRALNRLPVDAVLIESEIGAAPLSWRVLMQVQRTADFLVKPLLAAVPLNISQGELKALWEAGVDGVIVGLNADTAGQFTALRCIVDDPAFPAQRRRGKVEALLPYASGETQTIVPGEEDDEEEDE